MSDRGASELLAELNREYIQSVQHGNVERFAEVLADDFLCSNPDGSLLDKAQILMQTALPVTIKDLGIEDVRIRIFGEVAIIHARRPTSPLRVIAGPAVTPTCGRSGTAFGLPYQLT